MDGSHTSFSSCEKSGSLPSLVPQIPKHSHRKSLSSEVLGNAPPAALPVPSCRQVYLPT